MVVLGHLPSAKGRIQDFLKGGSEYEPFILYKRASVCKRVRVWGVALLISLHFFL